MISGLAAAGDWGFAIVFGLVSILISLVNLLVWLAGFALWVSLIVRTYQNEEPRVPGAASIAHRIT